MHLELTKFCVLVEKLDCLIG